MKIHDTCQNYIFYFKNGSFYYDIYCCLPWRLLTHSSFLHHVTSNDYACDFKTSDAQLYAQCIHDQTSSSLYQQIGNRVDMKYYHFGRSCFTRRQPKGCHSVLYAPEWPYELHQDNATSHLALWNSQPTKYQFFHQNTVF